MISILPWITNMKQNYLAKSPQQKWTYVQKLHVTMAKSLGCHCMVPEFAFTWQIITPMLAGLDFSICFIYTFYFYYPDRMYLAFIATPSFALIFPCIVVFGYIVVPLTRKQLLFLYNFANDYIYANSSPGNDAICDRWAIDLLSSSFRITSFVLISLGLVCCIPLYNMFLVENPSKESQAIIPVVVPFTDPEDEIGFQINIANQFAMALVGVIAIPTIEMITCILMNNTLVAAAVISNSFSEFQDFIANDNQLSVERDYKFRNIIIKIMDFDRYIEGFTDLFYWKLFIQPILLVYAIVYAICVYIWEGWGSAIGCICCSYVQLLILCNAGMKVEDANEMILKACNDFPLYLLSLEEQKMLALLLMRNQTQPKLRMGPFADLNYETATDLTKMTYTYTMYVMNAKG